MVNKLSFILLFERSSWRQIIPVWPKPGLDSISITDDIGAVCDDVILLGIRHPWIEDLAQVAKHHAVYL